MPVRWRTSTSGFQAPAQAEPGGGRKSQAPGGAAVGLTGLSKANGCKAVTAERRSPVKSAAAAASAATRQSPKAAVKSSAAAAATASAATRQSPKVAPAPPRSKQQPVKAAHHGTKEDTAAAAAARSERLRSALQQLRASRSPQQPAAAGDGCGAAGSTSALVRAAASAPAAQHELPVRSQAPPLVQHPTGTGCQGANLDLDGSLDDVLFDDVGISLLARLQLSCQRGTAGHAQQQQQSERERGREWDLPPGLPQEARALGSPAAGWLTAQQHSAARRALGDAAAEAELPLPAYVAAASCSAAARPKPATAAEVQQRLAQLRCSLRSPPLAAAPDAVTPRRLRVSAGDLVITRPPSAASCHGLPSAAYVSSTSDQSAAWEGSPRRRAGTATGSAAARLAALLAQPREQQVQQPWTWVQPARQHADTTTCSAALLPQAQPPPRAPAYAMAASLAGGMQLSLPGGAATRSPSRHAAGSSSSGRSNELAPLPLPAPPSAGATEGERAGSGDILEAWRSRRQAAQASHLAEKYGRYLSLQQQDTQQQQQPQQRQHATQQQQQQCAAAEGGQASAASYHGGTELSAPAAAGHPPRSARGGLGGSPAFAGAGGVAERRLALLQRSASVLQAPQQEQQQQQQQQQQCSSIAQARHQQQGQQQQQHHHHHNAQAQQQQDNTVQLHPHQQQRQQNTVSLTPPLPQQQQLREEPVDILERWRARRRQQGQAASSTADYGALLTLRLPGSSPGRHRQDPAARGAHGCTVPLAPVAAERYSTPAAAWSVEPAPAAAAAAAGAAGAAAAPGKLSPAEGLASPAQPSKQLAQSSRLEATLPVLSSPAEAAVQGLSSVPEVPTCSAAAIASQPAAPSSPHCSHLPAETPALAAWQAGPAPVPAPPAAAEAAGVVELAAPVPSFHASAAEPGAQAEPRAEARLPSRPLSAASSSGRATPCGSQTQESPSRQLSFGSACWSPGMSRLFDDVIGGLLFMDGQRAGCSTAEKAVEWTAAAAEETGACCSANPAEGAEGQAAGTGAPTRSDHSTEATEAGSSGDAREWPEMGHDCQQEAAAAAEVETQQLGCSDAGPRSSEGPGEQHWQRQARAVAADELPAVLKGPTATAATG